jgi:hypothetical protein
VCATLDLHPHPLQADANELREIEKQLLEVAKLGVSCDASAVPSRVAILARLKAARPATAELRDVVAQLEGERAYLLRLFDRAYDDHDPEATDTGAGAKPKAAAAAGVGGGGGGGEAQKQDQAALMSAMKASGPKQVPAMNEREASRFFLLNHMLTHLHHLEQYDMHGKVFYDLTGSHGQVKHGLEVESRY